MSPSYFPLHWESTGNKWWYASPIDLAAANGHYVLVRELLHLDMNLLIKLTSLRRIRRLETVWDDDKHFAHAAKCRSFVARNLFLECEAKKNKNSLIRAGYGGWLMYTASAAGDNGFVQELLERDPLLVFGEGEFGVADILYAAARSKNAEVFKTIFELALSTRCLVRGGGSDEDLGGERDSISVFRLEIINRAVLAAARGGNLDVLRELIGQSSDVLAYKDYHGATILHASAGRGRIEVVNYLVETYNIIECRDNQGNTGLHIAAFGAHLPVVEALISASSSLPYLTNNDGDTFLHTAVTGFQPSGFRRLDHQMSLVRKLISGNIINIQEFINMQNNNGRTVLHIALIGNLHSELIELLMEIPWIDINIEDIYGMTPLDLLRKRVCSASSNLLIKKLILAGGISNSNHSSNDKSAISSQLKIQPCTGNSPGTSFRIPDSEIFLYTGIDSVVASGRLSSSSTTEQSELQTSKKKSLSPFNAVAERIRTLLRFPHPKGGMKNDEREEIPTPLRQTFSNGASFLMNKKRTLAVRTPVPSPATKKKFAASLMHGVFRAMPLVASFSNQQTPVSPFSCSRASSSVSENLKDGSVDNENVESSSQISGFNMNSKFVSKYSSKRGVPPVG